MGADTILFSARFSGEFFHTLRHTKSTGCLRVRWSVAYRDGARTGSSTALRVARLAIGLVMELNCSG
jgi:hypothetical protein